MMQPREVKLGTLVRVHTNGKRARGVVAETAVDAFHPILYYRVVIQNGHPFTERKQNSNLWLRRSEITPYIPRTRTNPKTVQQRRFAKATWKANAKEGGLLR